MRLVCLGEFRSVFLHTGEYAEIHFFVGRDAFLNLQKGILRLLPACRVEFTKLGTASTSVYALREIRRL